MVSLSPFMLNQPFIKVPELEYRRKTSQALHFIYETEKHYCLGNYGELPRSL